MKELLSRSECSAMRGIAILAIMLHNYCHLIVDIVKENEFLYSITNYNKLLSELSTPDSLLPAHLLSFFGHYGVPIFIFLSGFGLVKKYESNPSVVPTIPKFLRFHYLKLMRMLIVGLTIFLIVDIMMPERFPFYWAHVLAQLAMIINVLPEPNHIIAPGIYWFFGLMMELYIVYRLFLFRRHNWYVLVLIVLCWLLQTICNPEGDLLNRLRYNFIGGMLPFGIGILVARCSWQNHICNRFVYFSVLFVSAALIVLMSFSFQTWLWIPLIVIIFTIAMVKVLPVWILKLLTWLGGVFLLQCLLLILSLVDFL